ARAINFYLVESPKLIQKLKQAAAANDAPEIVRSAHSLKSSSANLGASVLSRYCEDIEASARRADAEEACKLFAKIETEYGCGHRGCREIGARRLQLPVHAFLAHHQSAALQAQL